MNKLSLILIHTCLFLTSFQISSFGRSFKITSSSEIAESHESYFNYCKFSTSKDILFNCPVTTFPSQISVALDSIILPPNFDGTDKPALRCDEKIDRNKDISQNMSNAPECVDGYLLDSAFWYANPVEPDIYPNRRLPRSLGWNCIDDPADINFGHPNPDAVYYPNHTSWSPIDSFCWRANQHIMWQGTGRPYSLSCSSLIMSYTDTVSYLFKPGCDAGAVSCHNIQRTWTIFDSCSGNTLMHIQHIKIADVEGPKVLYPDTIRVNTEVWNCTGRWEVPPAWMVDNCSNEIHYKVEVEKGTLLGSEVDGYVVVNMPVGVQNGWIIAEDCCGNLTRKQITLIVEDNVPPSAICEQRFIVNITENQTPGLNFAKICAMDIERGSFDNCDSTVFFKIIRTQDLLGTQNGSTRNNMEFCSGFNGDDDDNINDNQVYFDDCVKFCCADVGKTILVVIRVFDRDPGPGSVLPSRMNPGGALFGRFSDCITEVIVQDKSVPTVVAPPDMVVSCSYLIDLNKIDDSNDRTFGRVVNNISDRGKVVSTDLVCANYCLPNTKTGYPGYDPNAPPSNPPAANKACDYYRSLFDTAHTDRRYELVWGFDGYVLTTCGIFPSITYKDFRKNGTGLIKRTIEAKGPNNIVVRATQTIWVVDCDAPKATCLPGIITVPLPATGCVEIFARDLNHGSADNCTPAENLNYYFNGDTTKASLKICCEDFVKAGANHELPVHVEMWVEDEAGNKDFCKATLVIQDNLNICMDVGVNDVHNNTRLIISPNPSNGTTLIQSENSMDIIKITYPSGVHFKTLAVKNKRSILIEELPAGIYLIEGFMHNIKVGSGKLLVLN